MALSWEQETWNGAIQALVNLLDVDPERKSSQILPNCILTILGCSMISLHLNVAAKGEMAQSQWKEWGTFLR